MKKPVILVHGAWHGAWCFKDLIDELGHRKISATAINLPLTGTDNDIDEARRCISEHPGAVVLGHSYGGLVITHAAKNLNVSHLVYLAALMPDQDENVNEKVAAAGPVALNDAIVVNDDGTLSINPDLAMEVFYHDCNPEAVKLAIQKLRPQVIAPFPVLAEEPAWKSVNSTYIVCDDDRALHTNLQRDFAKRASTTIHIDAAHSPFFSNPDEIADMIEPLTH